jgi:glycerol-3-phosphate acyltransferase PlsY
MLEWQIVLVAIIVGYLAGTISFTRLIARFIIPDEDISSTPFTLPGKDVTLQLTSVSPTALSMRKGPKAGCSAGILDMLKAFIPALIFFRLYPGQPYYIITAAMVMVGHNWPIQHRFKGGRGLSPMFGGLFLIDFFALPVAFIVSNVLGLVILKDVFFTYLAFVVTIIPYMAIRYFNYAAFSGWWFVGYAVWATAVYMIASLPETRQYLAILREGKIDAREDFLDMLELTDMGRPIKYMRKYGLMKPKAESTE